MTLFRLAQRVMNASGFFAAIGVVLGAAGMRGPSLAAGLTSLAALATSLALMARSARS